MTALTQEEAHRLFEYRDGALYWKVPKKGLKKIPNGDRPAGWKSCGYIKLAISGKAYYAHQVVFLMHHGYIPETVDHIDGNRQNNNVANLRPATKQQNNCNRPNVKVNPTSGLRGVRPSANGKKWHCHVGINKRFIHLGTFEDLDLAELVAHEARNLYHGSFANYGKKEHQHDR